MSTSDTSEWEGMSLAQQDLLEVDMVWSNMTVDEPPLELVTMCKYGLSCYCITGFKLDTALVQHCVCVQTGRANIAM